MNVRTSFISSGKCSIQANTETSFDEMLKYQKLFYGKCVVSDNRKEFEAYIDGFSVVFRRKPNDNELEGIWNMYLSCIEMNKENDPLEISILNAFNHIKIIYPALENETNFTSLASKPSEYLTIAKRLNSILKDKIFTYIKSYFSFTFINNSFDLKYDQAGKSIFSVLNHLFNFHLEKNNLNEALEIAKEMGSTSLGKDNLVKLSFKSFKMENDENVAACMTIMPPSCDLRAFFKDLELNDWLITRLLTIRDKIYLSNESIASKIISKIIDYHLNNNNLKEAQKLVQFITSERLKDKKYNSIFEKYFENMQLQDALEVTKLINSSSKQDELKRELSSLKDVKNLENIIEQLNSSNRQDEEYTEMFNDFFEKGNYNEALNTTKLLKKLHVMMS